MRWLVLATAVVWCGARGGAASKLWPRGVVHYAISQKDYDLHSQDMITTVFEAMEREVCVKFFHAPTNRTADPSDRILYVSNPDKIKNCPPTRYNYSGSVVDMAIGYKCLNTKDIARITVDMLRASVEQSDSLSSYDLLKKYQERDHDPSTLLSPDDRNYINSYYYSECGSLSARPFAAARRSGDGQALSSEAAQYYSTKLWPLGVVMYSVNTQLRGSPEHTQLKFAMTTVELSSCVVFQFHGGEDVLAPKNMLHFAGHGDDMPQYGFTEGNQTVSLSSMVRGAAGHTAHTLNILLRALGVPMMSNRFDRDNYVNINWRNVHKGKEYLLEKMPESAWVQSIPYDFGSATHAPANYACQGCELGAATVEPIQDHLWQRSLSMGHRAALSAADVKMLALLYGKECQRRTH